MQPCMCKVILTEAWTEEQKGTRTEIGFNNTHSHSWSRTRATDRGSGEAVYQAMQTSAHPWERVSEI